MYGFEEFNFDTKSFWDRWNPFQESDRTFRDLVDKEFNKP